MTKTVRPEPPTRRTR